MARERIVFELFGTFGAAPPQPTAAETQGHELQNNEAGIQGIVIVLVATSGVC